MRRAAILALFSVTLVTNSAISAFACGDKLLLLGRGIRYQSRHTPKAAAVLLYLPPSNRVLADPKLESALSEAGHRIRSVQSTEALQQALASGEFDLVMADVADAANLKPVLADGSFVIPAVYLHASQGKNPPKSQTKSDADRLAKEFGIVVRVPGRVGHYCAAVDKAMELKQKRARAKAPRK